MADAAGRSASDPSAPYAPHVPKEVRRAASTQPERSEDSGTSLGIERALQIVFAVAASREPDIGVSELARTLGLSKAVVHRVLRTLVAADFFSLDERTRRYRLGPGAVSVGLAAMAQMEVPKVAQPHLEQLVARTQETATLSARYGRNRMYLAQVLSPQEIRMSVQLGKLYPLHAGSSSKAILAALSDTEVEGYLAEVALDELTPITIHDPEALREEVRRVRETGFSVSRGERQPGAGSVGAPIFDATGRVYGSISVCGPVQRFGGGDPATFGPLVRDTARQISRELGHRVLDA